MAPSPQPRVQLNRAEKPTAASTAGPRLHVAIVDEELPFPPTSGKRIRTLNLVSRLARRHRIAYLCHRNLDAREVLPAREHFSRLGIEAIVVDRAPPRKSGPGFYLRLARNLLSPLPYSVVSHQSRALSEAIASYAAAHSVDLWHCEWTPYADSLKTLAGQKRLIMAHNVETQIWERYASAESHFLKRWYIRQQARKFASFERDAFMAADRVVTVSRTDAALATSKFRARRVSVVDNGVDIDHFHPNGVHRDRERILFLGSLDWRPNQYAVRLLISRILPLVRAEVKTAKLDIVGRNPPSDLAQEIERAEGVTLHPSVPDVVAYLNRSGVMAVPLEVGGGSRLKILEALATGLPVVSTAVGAEGLDLEPGVHYVLADTPEDIAWSLVRAIRNPDSICAMARAGRRVVLNKYHWDALADKLEQAWLECVGS